MVEAYPLSWPVGYPRTRNTQSSRFSSKSLAYTTGLIRQEVARLGGTQLIISTNVPLRNDGLPRSDYQKRIITDKGVAVYFMYKGKQVVMACDKWNAVEDNLYAISISVEAMRGLERWGVSDILERTFTGFQALPEAKNVEKTCWDILGIQTTNKTDEVVEAYKSKAKQVHPDMPGGNTKAFQELNDAYQEALSQIHIQ